MFQTRRRPGGTPPGRRFCWGRGCGANNDAVIGALNDGAHSSPSDQPRTRTGGPGPVVPSRAVRVVRLRRSFGPGRRRVRGCRRRRRVRRSVVRPGRTVRRRRNYMPGYPNCPGSRSRPNGSARHCWKVLRPGDPTSTTIPTTGAEPAHAATPTPSRRRECPRRLEPHPGKPCAPLPEHRADQHRADRPAARLPGLQLLPPCLPGMGRHHIRGSAGGFAEPLNTPRQIAVVGGVHPVFEPDQHLLQVVR